MCVSGWIRDFVKGFEHYEDVEESATEFEYRPSTLNMFNNIYM